MSQPPAQKAQRTGAEVAPSLPEPSGAAAALPDPWLAAASAAHPEGLGPPRAEDASPPVAAPVDPLLSAVAQFVGPAVNAAVGPAVTAALCQADALAAIAAALAANPDFVASSSAAGAAAGRAAATAEIVAHEQRTAPRFQAIEEDAAAANARIATAEAEIARLSATTARLAERLCIAEASDPPPRPINAGFMRPPDPTILRVNAATNTGRTAIKEALDVAWGSILPSADFKVESIGQAGGPSRNFLVRFTGAAGLQANRVDAIMGNLKDETGAWKMLTATDTSGAQSRIYTNRDENLHMQRLRAKTRALRKAIADADPDMEVRAIQADGRITWKSRTVAKVTVEQDSTDASFNAAVLRERPRLNASELLAAIRRSPDDSIEWLRG